MREFSLSLAENKTPKTIRKVTFVAYFLFIFFVLVASKYIYTKIYIVGLLIYDLWSEKQIENHFHSIDIMNKLSSSVSILPLFLRIFMNILTYIHIYIYIYKPMYSEIEPNSSPILIQETRFNFYKVKVIKYS